MIKLSIIIPVYNEKETIEKLLDLVERVDLSDVQKEIVIIDDKSTDGTREILERYRDKCRLIFQPKNMGKGAAVKAGFQAASGDILIIQDADLEYDPNEYQKLLKPILENRADIVFGSRFVGSEPHRVLYFWHYQGNRFLTFLSNLLSGLSLTDMEACYKMFNRQAIDFIKGRLTAKRFGIEPELAALAAKSRLKVYEVGISYYGRTYQEGKKITWKDGLMAIYYVVKYNLFR